MAEVLMELDIIGGLTGTDKSSANHNYLVHYDRAFREFRDQAINVLEIGIFRGASLEMWHQYFSQARIIGVDIHEDCRKYAHDRIVVELGSQDDPGFLADLARRHPASIIIDDGSHLAHHVIFTFESLFPTLAPGGFYVIEDLHFHAGDMRGHTQGHSAVNPIDYVLSLSRTVVTNELAPEKRWGFQAYALKYIDEVTFFGKAVLIRKKARPADPQARITAAIAFAEQVGTADAWDRASQYLAGNGAAQPAIDALERANEIAPSARFYLRLSQLHAKRGEAALALAMAEKSLVLAADGFVRGECLEQFADLLISARRTAEAVSTYHEAVSMVTHPVVQARIKEKIQQHSTESASTGSESR